MKKLDKKWKILQAARKKLSDDRMSLWEETDGSKRVYLCHAVTEVTQGKTASVKKLASEIKTMISDRLNHCATLDQWMMDYAPHGSRVSLQDYNADRYNNSGRKMQATRKLWADNLIEEYKAKDE